MHSQGTQSQDLEARFAVFLNPIRDLTKNWDIDIAKYLEDYLEELSHIQITFDGGRTVMNFAEAAMLIQGSATVYSKKVEFLWQMVLQMLDLLSSKRAMEKNGEAASSGGRRRPTLLPREFEEVNDLSIGKNIQMKNESEAEQHKREFKFLPAQPLHLMERQRQRGRAQIALFLKNMESFGYKDDYRINRSYMNPLGFLCLHIPEAMLKRGRRLSSDLDSPLAEFLTPLPALNSSTHEKAPLDRSPMADDGVDHGGGEFPDNDDMNSASNEAYPPPPPEVGELKEECSLKGVVDQTRTKRCGLRQAVTAAPKEVLADAMLLDPLQPLDPHLETPTSRPVRAVCLNRRSRFKLTPSRVSKGRKSGRPESTAPVVPSVESFIIRDLVDLVRRQENSGRKIAALDPRLVTELVREETRRCTERRAKCKAVPPTLGDNGERPPSPLEDELDRDDEILPDLDLDAIGPQLDGLDLPNPHPVDGLDDPIHTPFGAISSAMDGWGLKGGLNDSHFYEPGSEYEALVQKWVSDVVTSAQDQVMSSGLTQRVNNWRTRIMPRLQQEEQRSPFDIHQCGTGILALFPEVGNDESTPTMLFAELARGHEAHHVSRLFLSCLMLANSYNVELSQTVKGDLKMDVLQLRLLSRERQLHHLEEYTPPSANLKDTSQQDSPPSTDIRKLPRLPAPSNPRGTKRKKTPASFSSSASSEEDTYSDASSTRRRSHSSRAPKKRPRDNR